MGRGWWCFAFRIGDCALRSYAWSGDLVAGVLYVDADESHEVEVALHESVPNVSYTRDPSAVHSRITHLVATDSSTTSPLSFM